MENCLVPIEVCERVIDACYQPENLRGWRTRVVTSSYFTWQQTALVCSAWLARSRLNLLHEVVLCSTTQVDLLIRTLLDDVPAGNSTGHRLADVVVCMTVHAWDAYVPFTRMPLQSMLCKCVTYNLAEIGWRDHYPLRLIDAFMSSLWGKGIISLQISLERGLLFAVMHLIWALPMLQDLELHSSYKTLTFSALPRTPSTAACQNLRRLVIWYRSVSISYPLHAFGHSIQDLSLCIDEPRGFSDSVLDIIRGSPRLQKLRLTIFLDRDSQYEVVVRRILDSISPESETGLQSVMIDLESAPDHHGVALRLHQRYFRDRNSLLDSLAAFEQLAYAKTPELHELHFKLSDHDDVHDSAWWKAQLVQRARNVPKRFHSAVVVGVGRKTAGSGHLWQYLWSVGELPKSDAGTLEANADHVGD